MEGSHCDNGGAVEREDAGGGESTLGRSSFARAVNSSLNAVTPITWLMRLAELQNPPAMVRIPIGSHAGEVFYARLHCGPHELHENGANIRLESPSKDLLNPPAGREMEVLHRKWNGRGRLEPSPDLVPGAG